MVGGVELHGGLSGADFHEATGGGLINLGGEFEAAAVEDEVVIITAALLERKEVVVDLLADGFGTGEVEGGAEQGGDLSGGDHLIGGGRVTICGDGELVVEDAGVAGPGEVEVAVVGEVEDGGGVGGGVVVDSEGIAVDKRVGDGSGEGAGVAFLACGTGVAEFEGETSSDAI